MEGDELSNGDGYRGVHQHHDHDDDHGALLPRL
jgi:hypothetical protein